MTYARAIAVVYGTWILAYGAAAAYGSAWLPRTDLSTPLDARIPTVPAFVWLYDACFLLPFVPLVAPTDPVRLNRALGSVAVAILVASLFYVLLRVAPDKPVLGSSAAERLLSAQYSATWVVGANNFPSMHVTFAWLLFLLWRTETWAVDAALFAVAVAVSLSTLFVKMHLVVDVVGGVACAFGCWHLSGILLPELNTRTDPPIAALRLVRRRLARLALWGCGLLVLATIARQFLRP